MNFYWVEFQIRPGGTVEASSEEEAKVIAAQKTGFPVREAWMIPYPATPIIHETTGVPGFCYTPRTECRGKASCPRKPTCPE